MNCKITPYKPTNSSNSDPYTTYFVMFTKQTDLSTPPCPREEQNNQHTSELNNSFKARPKQPSHLAMQFHMQVNTIKTTHNYKFITQEKLQITDQK